jgi:hypothetical protein
MYDVLNKVEIIILLFFFLKKIKLNMNLYRISGILESYF